MCVEVLWQYFADVLNYFLLTNQIVCEWYVNGMWVLNGVCMRYVSSLFSLAVSSQRSERYVSSMSKNTCPISKWVCCPHTHLIPKVQYRMSLWSTYSSNTERTERDASVWTTESLWNAGWSFFHILDTYGTVSIVSGGWRVRKTGAVGGWQPWQKWYLIFGVFRRFLTPWCYSEKMTHTLNLIRT